MIMINEIKAHWQTASDKLETRLDHIDEKLDNPQCASILKGNLGVTEDQR